MNRIFSVVIVLLIGCQAFSQNGSEAKPNTDEKVYVAVEHQAVPDGGIKQFYADFIKEFKSPEVEKGINEVRLMLSFVVEKDGSLSDFKVLRDGGMPKAGTEAIRVLKGLPKWKPAFQNGQEVRSQFTLPLIIQVENNKKPFSHYLNKA